MVGKTSQKTKKEIKKQEIMWQFIVGFVFGALVLTIIQKIEKNHDRYREIPRRIKRRLNKWVYFKLKDLAWDALELEAREIYTNGDLKGNDKSGHYKFTFKFGKYEIDAYIKYQRTTGWKFIVRNSENKEIIRSKYEYSEAKFQLHNKLTPGQTYRWLLGEDADFIYEPINPETEFLTTN